MPVRTERSERWVRGFVGDTAVVDCRAPVLFWEERRPVPSYAYDPADVRMDLFAEGERPATYSRHFGPGGPVTQWYDIQLGDRRLPAAAWTRDAAELAGLMIVSWQPGVLDRWMEEDELVFAHPRDPHHRVDALPSSRHVTVSLDGRLLAESDTPVLVFETGLPTRYYLPPEDLVSPDLSPSSHETFCPYKGVADRYWSLPTAQNIAWSYTDPVPAVEHIAGRVAFYNEFVDIAVDGVAQPRPSTPFSAGRP
ncbi:MAG: DUF427 domain-containing protein [Dermatophilaceae bacterium]